MRKLYCRKSVIGIFASLVLIFGNLFAQDQALLFTEANKAYQEGDYKTAVEKYETVLHTGSESWEVYYNLGNAFYQQGDVARAILNYERAKRLEPDNEDTDYNLEFAHLRVVDRIQEMPRFMLSRWLDAVTHIFGIETLTAVVIVVYLMLIIFLIVRMLLRSVRSSRPAFVSIIGLALFLLISSTVLLARIYEAETRVEAIVLVDKVDVKSAPDNAGTDVFTLHAGVKVEVKDTSLDWVRIRLTDGKIGWLREQSIEII